MLVTIYHNPKCSKSRQALKLIEKQGHSPLIIDYMSKKASEKELHSIIRLMGIKAHELIRSNEQDYEDRSLCPESSENDLIYAMSENPSLIERPIVLTEKGARIGRPTEAIMAIL